MTPSIAASRIRALLNSLEHPVGTNDWLVNRLLANRKIDTWEILAQATNLSGREILLGWAAKTPDYPLSPRQASVINTLLCRFREDNIDIGSIVLVLAQSNKWACLHSFLSGLDSPKVTQQAGRQLLFASNINLSPKADKVILFIAQHSANYLADHLRADSVTQSGLSSTVWRFGKLGEHFQVLEECINYLGPCALEDDGLYRLLVKINALREQLINVTEMSTKSKFEAATTWLSPTLQRHALGKVASSKTKSAEPSPTNKPSM